MSLHAFTKGQIKNAQKILTKVERDSFGSILSTLNLEGRVFIRRFFDERSMGSMTSARAKVTLNATFYG